jgi:hypothetical protein
VACENKLTRLQPGSFIPFCTVKHEKLLRTFLDTIGSEDAHQLVHVRNAEYETMLYGAVVMNKLESVKLLLDYGADPSARNLSGATPLLLLRMRLSLSGSFPMLPLEAMIFFATKKSFDEDEAHAIQQLLEERGSPDDMIDGISSRTEIEELISGFSSSMKVGDLMAKLRNIPDQDPLNDYLNGRNLYALDLLRSIEEGELLSDLSKALSQWADKRKRNIIPRDELPDGWGDFLADYNKGTNGSLTNWMQDDETPEITKMLKGLAISICEWVVDKDVPAILADITALWWDTLYTGANAELITHGSAVAAMIFRLVEGDQEG